MKIATIIPIYKEHISKEEHIILDNNVSKLKDDSDIIFVCPQNFNNSEYVIYSDKFEYFDDEYFKSNMTYNKLMINIDFYKRFEYYDYILICQTDVWVFKKELKLWAEKGYDYIGAPWLMPGFLANKIGNGGFSLRKVKTYIDLLKRHPNIGKYRKGLNEDVLLASYAKEILHENINIPTVKEAIKFSVETGYPLVRSHLENKFPFGMHAVKIIRGILFEMHGSIPLLDLRKRL